MTPATRPGPVDLDRRPRSRRRPLGPAGLVVGVVQDVADGRVLMVGWLDVEALAATLGTGEVHFHSRSRGRLWRKGESSGHVLRLRGARARLRRRRAADRRRAGRAHLPPRHALLLRPGRHVPGRRRILAPWTSRPSRPARTRRGSPGSSRCGPRSPTGPRPARRARTRSRCSTAAWTSPAARSPRRRPRCSSPPRTTRRPRPRARTAARRRDLLAGEAGDLLYHALVLLAERGMEPRAVLDVLRAPPRDVAPS